MKTYQAHSHVLDKINYVLGCYIPDVHNPKYRYVIEVDGSYHELPKQKVKDIKKDLYFNKLGYKVIRVVAYSDASLAEAIRTVLELRNGSPVLDDKTAAGWTIIE